MPKYIDVEKIKWRWLPISAINDVFITVSDIAQMPAADVVKVVRCKDCIYNDASKDESGYHCTRYGMWGNNGSSFYCADGKRKGENR